jgi:hypothetical protein
MRIEPLERPAVVGWYWLIGAVLFVPGLYRLVAIRSFEDLAIVAIMLVLGALALYGAFVTTYALIVQGPISLELSLPGVAGGRLQAKLVSKNNLAASQLTAELRCVEVISRHRRGLGNSFNESKVVWRKEATFAVTAGPAGSECPITFTLPADALPTEGQSSIYTAGPGRFWEIICSIDSGTKILLRSYRVPVGR